MGLGWMRSKRLVTWAAVLLPLAGLAVWSAITSPLDVVIHTWPSAPVRSGPLQVRLVSARNSDRPRATMLKDLYISVPGVVPPASHRVRERITAVVEITNGSESSAPVRYPEGELSLYRADGRKVEASPGPTRSTAQTGDGRQVDPTSDSLAQGATVLVSREFLVSRDGSAMTLVCRVPGHREFTWPIQLRRGTR